MYNEENYSTWQINVLCELDRLRQLIKNCKKDGKFTKAKKYEDYYNEVRSRPKFKDIIKNTIHQDNGEI